MHGLGCIVWGVGCTCGRRRGSQQPKEDRPLERSPPRCTPHTKFVNFTHTFPLPHTYIPSLTHKHSLTLSLALSLSLTHTRSRTHSRSLTRTLSLPIGRYILVYMEKMMQTPMAKSRSTKIIKMMKWIRTSTLSIKNSVSRPSRIVCKGISSLTTMKPLPNLGAMFRIKKEEIVGA